MELSSFFDAEQVDGILDRLYNADDWARYFKSFIGNGIFAEPSNNLQVVSDRNDMSIAIEKGKAWINGYFYENTEQYVMYVDVADGVLNRIDRIVVRLDFLTRDIKVYIKKGELASIPTIPTLERTDDIYELGLATITINKGVTKVTQADVTDTRYNDEICGVVKGVVEQIDVTNLFAQYESAFEQWFTEVKDQLSGDVAGNLQGQIDELGDKFIDKLETEDQLMSGNLLYPNNAGIGGFALDETIRWLAYIGADDKAYIGSDKAELILQSSISPKAKVGQTLYDLYHSGTTTINVPTVKATSELITERYGNVGRIFHQDTGASNLGKSLLIKNNSGGTLYLTNADILAYRNKNNEVSRIVTLQEDLGLDGNYRIWWGAENDRPHNGIQFVF